MPDHLHVQHNERSEPTQDRDTFEMDEGNLDPESSRPSASEVSRGQPSNGLARHTLGLLLLLLVVFLWTLSNFLGSSIFADNTYAKPFFLTYVNTSTFMLAMLPTLIRSTQQARREGTLRSKIRNLNIKRKWKNISYQSSLDGDSDSESEAFLKPNQHSHTNHLPSRRRQRTHLGFIPTARLALAFCLLWFSANYFAISCLQFTTVASATILTSTSSVWTLLIGAFTHTEKFTWRKLCGVLGSIVGIVLISRVDLSNKPADIHPGNVDHLYQHQPISSQPHLKSRALNPFPDKSPSELALGDIIALLSAIIYGIYTITLKKSSMKAQPLQLNMPLFFGLVGTFNFVLLAPMFPILHFTGIEKFEFPPTRRIWAILLTNSFSSLVSDICWAYAMVLTSPLVVTVGLSLTIPLSLVGEMLIQGRYEGWIYWVGAAVVVGSFVFVDREEVREGGGDLTDETRNDILVGEDDDGSVQDGLLQRNSSTEELLHRDDEL